MQGIPLPSSSFSLPNTHFAPVPGTQSASNPSLQFDQDTLAKFQQAKAAGVPDEINYQKAAQYQSTKTASQPDNSTRNKILDLLPLIGGIGGSFIPGAGTIVGGALGAGGATLLKQLLENKPVDPGEALKQAAFAGAGGAVGEGLGFLGSKLLPELAPELGTAGEKLAAKAFRVTPGQATKFASETGEDFGKFLSSRGITNAGALDTAVTSLQKPFDDIVLSSNLKVPPENILSKFTNKISELKGSYLPVDQAKGEALDKIATNFLDQYGSAPIPAEKLTSLRKELDDMITKFPMDETTKGPLNLTRDVIQNSIRDSADQAGLNINGKNLKDAGVELSKLYKAQEIATRQANLGVGTMPLGITKLLAGGAGLAGGGIPGATAAIGGVEALNNPGTLGMFSKLLTGASKVASHIPALPEATVPSLVRGGIGAGSLFGMPGQVQASSQGALPDQSIPLTAGNDGTYRPDTVPQGNLATPGVSAQSSGQNDQIRQLLGAVMLKNAKSVTDVKTAYDFMNPAKKPLSDTQQKTKAGAESGLRALNTVEAILKTDPNAPLKARIPGVKGRSPYAAAAQEMTDVLTRLRTGAALNKEEQAFYEGQLPQFYDSPQTIQYKLGIFRNLFNTLAYGQTPTGGDITVTSPGF